MTRQEVQEHVGKTCWVAYPDRQVVRPVKVIGEFLSFSGYYVKFPDDAQFGECCPIENLHLDDASARKHVLDYCSGLAHFHTLEAEKWRQKMTEFCSGDTK